MATRGDKGRSHVYLLAAAFMGIALAFSLSRSGLFALVGVGN